MPSILLIVIYCLLILLASIAGGLVPLYVRLTHKRMEIAVSFVAGVMLGVGLMHLLGHALGAVAEPGSPGSIDGVIQWLLAGVLVMFFFERFFSFHHHDVPDDEGHIAEEDCHNGCDSSHDHKMTWGGAALGLSIHSMIAGVALAAAVQYDLEAHGAALAGLGIFLVIFLHKPFDSLTIGTLMAKGGWSPMSRHVVNGLFALAIPLGVAAFHLGILRHASPDSPALPYALAFSAGTFLCISMSDILPELQFHRHDRVKLTISLLLGLSVAWGIALLETGHQHG